jgi:hypothetical protein
VVAFLGQKIPTHKSYARIYDMQVLASREVSCGGFSLTNIDVDKWVLAFTHWSRWLVESLHTVLFIDEHCW